MIGAVEQVRAEVRVATHDDLVFLINLLDDEVRLAENREAEMETDANPVALFLESDILGGFLDLRRCLERGRRNYAFFFRRVFEGTALRAVGCTRCD